MSQTKFFNVSKGTVTRVAIDGSPKQGCGGSKRLYVGRRGIPDAAHQYDLKSYLRFTHDWTDVGKIVSATIVVYTDDQNGDIPPPSATDRPHIAVVLITDADGFDEGNNTDGNFDASDFTAPAYTSSGKVSKDMAKAPGAVNRIDVTAFMEQMAPANVKRRNGQPGGKKLNHGFALIGAKDTALDWSGWSENATDSGVRPQLELVYELSATKPEVPVTLSPAGSVPSIGAFGGTFSDIKPEDYLAFSEVEVYTSAASNVGQTVSGGARIYAKKEAASSSERGASYFNHIPDNLTLAPNTNYKWRARVWDQEAQVSLWTDLITFQVTNIDPDPPVLTPDGSSYATLAGVLFRGGEFSDTDGGALKASQVQLSPFPEGDARWDDEADGILWDTGKRPVAGGSTNWAFPYGGRALDADTYYWRARQWDTSDGLSEWAYATITLTEDFEPLPGSSPRVQFSPRVPWRIRILDVLDKVPPDIEMIQVAGTAPNTCTALNSVVYTYTPSKTFETLGPATPINVGGDTHYTFTSTDDVAYYGGGGDSHYPSAGDTGDWGNGGVCGSIFTAGGVDYNGGGLPIGVMLRVIGPGTMTIHTAAHPGGLFGSCGTSGTIGADAHVSGTDALVDSDSAPAGTDLVLTIPDDGLCAHYILISSSAGPWGFGGADWVAATSTGSVVFPDPLTPGNTVFAWLSKKGSAPALPAGFTNIHAPRVQPTGNMGWGRMCYRPVAVGDTGIIDVPLDTTATFMEFSGVYSGKYRWSSSHKTTVNFWAGGSLYPTTNINTVILSAGVIGMNDSPSLSLTYTGAGHDPAWADVIPVADTWDGTAPLHWVGYRPQHKYGVTGASTGGKINHTARYGGVTLAITSRSVNRGPNRTVALIEDAKAPGASLLFNSPGELHFTLPIDHPQISVIEPKQTHYEVEFYKGDGWRSVYQGWVWDLDATETEVIFYGLDYLGAYDTQMDERYDPGAPDKPADKGGSKYVNKTIHDIVLASLTYAKTQSNSPVGFISIGPIATMNEKVTTWSTMTPSLSFISGLLDSHRQGTGKRTRIQVIRTADRQYQVRVVDDPGEVRDNLRLKYGELLQGFRIIPFGPNWASRQHVIGRQRDGLKVLYKSANAPGIDQSVFGNITQAQVMDGVSDENDLIRRLKQAALHAGKLGKSVAIGLRIGVLSPFDGYDIPDSFPLDITKGPIHTASFGSGYWDLYGVTWEVGVASEQVLGFTVLPHEDNVPPDTDLVDSSPISPQAEFQPGYGPPDPTTNHSHIYIDLASGIVYERHDDGPTDDDPGDGGTGAEEEDNLDP